MDINHLKKNLKQALAISVSGMVLSWVLGAVFAFMLYDYMDKDTVKYGSFVIFVGVSLAITAFPVLARIMTDRKMLQCKVGQAALSAAAIGDAGAWCMLVLVVAIAGNGHDYLLVVWGEDDCS